MSPRSSITADFADALSTVSRPSAFFVAGVEQMLAPGLAVEGIGPIALPLLPIQAEQLVGTAARAPYGRGENTLTDINVRRTWQIGAERVRIEGKHWPNTLQAIVGRVAEGLGVADPVEAELYKLLVYDQGSFFVRHRDTEKAAGMFATLVLALPSVSEGGELIVRHGEREVCLNLRCEEASDVAFAAFYADCVHEVRPVTAGYRLVLVYNLLRRGPGCLPEPPNYGDEQNAVATLLRQWVEAADDPEDDEPQKLVYPLEHAYTAAELGFESLKGADAGIAQVIVAAAREACCDVHLALVSVEESGIAEYTGNYGRSRRDYDDDDDDDDDFEVVEVSERIAVASHWRRPDGAPSPLTEIPVEETEFSPPLSFEELEPDEQHFREATGNEGASFERTYKRAALLLWPSDRLLAVINQAGLGVTLPFLEDLADRWTATGEASIRDEANRLSDHIIASWRIGEWYPRRDDERTEAGHFLNLLSRLEDTAHLDSFLAELATRGGFDVGDAVPISDALLALPADRAASLARGLLEAGAESALTACGALLVRLSAAAPSIAVGAGRILVAALPGDPSLEAAERIWRRGPGLQPAFIVDLFTALGRIDLTLAAVAADHVLEWPGTYDFDRILVPAVRDLLDAAETAVQAPVQRLRSACLAHLDARIGLPLEAPADWRRDSQLGCNCSDCRALGIFLDDAATKDWSFAAAEPRRRHLEATIRAARCDLDIKTAKHGRPYSLVCTKNQASYHRRCKQRADDLAERQRLNA